MVITEQKGETRGRSRVRTVGTSRGHGSPKRTDRISVSQAKEGTTGREGVRISYWSTTHVRPCRDAQMRPPRVSASGVVPKSVYVGAPEYVK